MQLSVFHDRDFAVRYVAHKIDIHKHAAGGGPRFSLQLVSMIAIDLETMTLFPSKNPLSIFPLG